MRSIAALLLIAVSASADCLISNCSDLRVTDSSVTLHCEIDSTGTNVDLVRIGRFTSGVADSAGTQHPGKNPGANVQAWGIWNSDFTAGATQEVFPQYSTDGGTTWSTPATDEGSGSTCAQTVCPSGVGVQPGGYSCDANNMISVTLDAAPSPGPVEEPNEPVHTNTGQIPAITGNTYTISACSEVQDKFDAAAAQANSDNLVHEVAWEATGVCHPGQFSTPATHLDLCGVTTATGGVVWTGGMPDEDLDRHGARPEADFWGHGPTLTYDPADWALTDSLIQASCDTKRIFFSGTYSIGTPSRDAIVADQPADAPIIAVSTFGSQRDITLSGGTGLANINNVKMRVHVPGIQDRLGTWGGFYHAIGSGTKIRTGFAVTGTWTSGGGLTRQRIKPFTATAASEPVLTLSHLLGDGHAFGITSISSDVLTTSGTHTITYNNYKAAFLIDGCDAASDGVNYATAGSSTTLTLARSVSDCTGGTVRQLNLVQLSNMSGIDTDALSCVFTVTSSTQIQLLECTDGQTAGVPDWSAGSSITGDATFDPTPYPPAINANNISESVFSGFIVRGNQGGLPWATTLDGFLVNDDEAENLALTESLFDGTHVVRAISPTTGIANETTHNDIYVSAAVNANQAPGFYIRSIDSFTCGFLVFEETFSDIPVLTDFSLLSSRQFYDERFLGGADNSNGFACQVRQGVELKPGALRWEITGNTFWNVPVVGTNTNAAITAIRSSNGTNTSSGEPWGVQDGIIESNFGTGRLFMSLGLYEPGGTDYEYLLTPERFRISNNLWFTREGFHSSPCNERLHVTTGCFLEVHSGLGTVYHGNNVEISNNTVGLRQTTTGVYSYLLEERHTAAAAAYLISGNVQILSHETPYDTMRCDGTHSWAACEDIWTEEGGASTRFTMEDTTLIPCTLAPSTTDWTATNAAHSDVATAWSGWPVGKKPAIITGSSDGQSCWERIRLAFNDDWTRKAALSGGGHDQAALMAAQGRPVIPDDNLEFNVNEHAARLTAYSAPNDQPCNLCARPEADDRGDSTGICAEDSGARTNRSVELDLTTLTGQTVKLDLLCEQGVIYHWQGTAP